MPVRCDCQYKGTSLRGNRPFPPWDHHRALSRGLLKKPRGARFLWRCTPVCAARVPASEPRGFQGLPPERPGQSLVLSVLYVPFCLEGRHVVVNRRSRNPSALNKWCSKLDSLLHQTSHAQAEAWCGGGTPRGHGPAFSPPKKKNQDLKWRGG